MNHPFIMWQSHSNPDALGSHSERIYACISAHAAMEHCQLVLEVLMNGLITRSSCEIVRVSNMAHMTQLQVYNYTNPVTLTCHCPLTYDQHYLRTNARLSSQQSILYRHVCPT